MTELPHLTPADRTRYEWQIWVPDFGEQGQRRLKGATVLVSRIGGVGGAAAMQLAAAGVGRLILVHGGELRLNDLNRQLLMSTAGIGQPRVNLATERLQELNPNVEIEAIAANMGENNAAELISRCDLIVSAAPLFAERLLMNREAVRQRKPLVDCAMYDLEGRLTTIIPGQTPCLACIYPEPPVNWKREFPVLSAVSSTVGSMAGMEAIKVLANLGEPLASRLLVFDLRAMSFQTVSIPRRPHCSVCGDLFR